MQYIYSKLEKMAKTTLTIKSNGSIKVEGDFEIVDQDGNIYNINGRNTIGICRCGLSAIMPFCDGAHKGKFEHQAKAFDLNTKKQS